MVEYGLCFPALDAGKPLDKLFDRGAVLQILEQRSYGDPCAAKHPSPAKLARFAFDSRAV